MPEGIISSEERKQGSVPDPPDGKRDWKVAIEASIAHRNLRIGDNRKYYDMYRDIWEDRSQTEQEHFVSVNMIFANTVTLLPLVYFKNPTLTVIPKRPHAHVNLLGSGLTVNALPDYELMERIVNHKLTETRFYKTERMAALDCFLAGTGITKVGYSQTFEIDKMRGETFVVEDELWIQRVNPFHFLIDPLALDESSARWMGEERLVPWTEVVRKYGNTKVMETLKPTHRWTVEKQDDQLRSSPGTSISFERILNNEQQWDPELSVVLLYEIWDISEGKVLVMAEGHEDEPLEVADWPFEGLPPEDPFPYNIMRFHDDPDSIWGLSPVRPYEAQQHELNFHRSKLAAIHGKTARKYGILEGSLEPEEEDKLVRGDDGAVVHFKFPPDRAFKVIQENVFNADIIGYDALIKGDINTLSGVDEATRGQVTKGRTTATEISQLSAGLEIRSDDKRTQVEKHIKYTWKKAINILVEMMTGEQYANFYDEEKEKPVVAAFKSKDIKGSYDIDVEVGSTAMPNKEVKQQLLINLAGILLQSPNINQKEFFRQILKTFDLDPSGMLMDAPPPPLTEAPGSLIPGTPQGGGAQEAVGQEPTTAGIARANSGSRTP